ncbi:MAG: GAF and ANTAR domain-containing protein [Candidatus Omnitrophica bacterium]|nr:GAF and ANTAR domain-containing protein [Candidatus Omnitrophota bacterium]
MEKSTRIEAIQELKKELRQKSREIELLHKITEAIYSTLDLNEVLKEIIDVVTEVTKADACLIYLVNDEKNELVLKASKNPHPRIIGRIKIKVGEGITGWVAQEKKPVAITQQASEDSRFKFFHNLPEDKYEAFLSVPIIIKDELIGVINAQHKMPHHHRDDEIALLITIARQVAFAIHNAQLYHKTVMMEEALQVRKIIEKAKGVLMRQYNISEDYAFRMLQRQSMNTRKSMREIAEAIILTSDIKAPPGK